MNEGASISPLPEEAPDGLTVRASAPSDLHEIWPLAHRVFTDAESWPHAPSTSPEEFADYWFGERRSPYVAHLDGSLAGIYLLRPNQPYLGDHVANGGYMVSPDMRGRGVGVALARHSLAEARRLGYRAVQFNLVVSTNTAAVRAWTRAGFETVGTLPGAFRLRDETDVDALVMYHRLD